MELKELIDHLNYDLSNEYAHWHFYINAAVRVQGLHRVEIREFLLEQAQSEMKHIQEFADLITGLGGTPISMPSNFESNTTNPCDILTTALHMEQEVLNNYLVRMNEAEIYGGVDGKRIVIFLEDQMDHSSKDADEMKQMLAAN